MPPSSNSETRGVKFPPILVKYPDMIDLLITYQLRLARATDDIPRSWYETDKFKEGPRKLKDEHPLGLLGAYRYVFEEEFGYRNLEYRTETLGIVLEKIRTDTNAINEETRERLWGRPPPEKQFGVRLERIRKVLTAAMDEAGSEARKGVAIDVSRDVSKESEALLKGLKTFRRKILHYRRFARHLTYRSAAEIIERLDPLIEVLEGAPIRDPQKRRRRRSKAGRPHEHWKESATEGLKKERIKELEIKDLLMVTGLTDDKF